MKFTTCVLALLSSIQILNAQSYTFDKEGYLPPKGLVLERKSSMSLENGKLQIIANEREMKGEVKTVKTNEETLTYLGDHKMLSLIKKDTTNSESTLAGKALPKKEKENPLTGRRNTVSKGG